MTADNTTSRRTPRTPPRLALVLFALLVGCSSPSELQPGASTSGGEQAASTPSTPTSPAPTSIVDAEIPNPCDGGTVRLRGGAGEYPSTIEMEEPGSLEVRDVGIADLDGDGVSEHVAMVLCMPGGSGTFDSVRAYHWENGRFVEVAAIEGGDRADGGLDVARIEGDAVVVGRFSGDEEGLCCPTHVTDETWQLRDGAFVRTAQGERREYANE
ncbi:MAG: hypothetical protein R3B99_36740 [Polyangiales bacterium]